MNVVQITLVCLALSGCVFDTAGTAPAPLATDQSGPAALDARVDGPTTTGDGHPTVDTGDETAAPDAKSSDTTPDGPAPVDSKPAADATPDAPAPVDSVPADDTQPAVDSAPWPDLQLPSCTVKYGAALDFYLCDETPTSCRFYVKTNEDTCGNLCPMFGGTCLGGYDNSGYCNSTGQSSSCDWVHSTQICICSR